MITTSAIIRRETILSNFVMVKPAKVVIETILNFKELIKLYRMNGYQNSLFFFYLILSLHFLAQRHLHLTQNKSKQRRTMIAMQAAVTMKSEMPMFLKIDALPRRLIPNFSSIPSSDSKSIPNTPAILFPISSQSIYSPSAILRNSYSKNLHLEEN